MDDPQFDRHALSLYRFFRERGCLVAFQLWTTEDGGEHFKISCRPTLPSCPLTLHYHPTTKLYSNKIPLFPKTRKSPCRQLQDQRRLEPHRAAKQTGSYSLGAETSCWNPAPITGTPAPWAGILTPGAGNLAPGAGTLTPGAGTLAHLAWTPAPRHSDSGAGCRAHGAWRRAPGAGPSAFETRGRGLGARQRAPWAGRHILRAGHMFGLCVKANCISFKTYDMLSILPPENKLTCGVICCVFFPKDWKISQGPEETGPNRAASQTGPYAPESETSGPWAGTSAPGTGILAPVAGTPAPVAGTHSPWAETPSLELEPSPM